jgi:queuine tRNA-ribosyltransferase
VRPVGFELVAMDGEARAGQMELTHGPVDTPVYMPVGTQGAVRSVSPLHLADTGTQIVLANTYHLSQRPGEALVKKAGGLHKLMAIDLPILTDSGGFQVFSLDKTVTEDGVTFRYEVDGKKTFLSPERSMNVVKPTPAAIRPFLASCRVGSGPIFAAVRRSRLPRSASMATLWVGCRLARAMS